MGSMGRGGRSGKPSQPRELRAVVLLAPVGLLMAAAFLFPLGFVVFNSFYANGPTLRAYAALGSSPLFLRVLWTTFEISFTASLVSLVLGYILALHLARQPPRRRMLLMIFILLPFWTSILVKSYAFTIILGHGGLINESLQAAFGAGTAIDLLFNRTGVVIGMSHYLIPFAVFPVLTSLRAQDRHLYRAARVMGAGPVRIFLKVTLPLSLPGVLAGFLMTMVLSLGMFITPALLGGRRDMMMANLVDFFTRETLDWNMAAAIAMILTLMSALLILLLLRVRGADQLI